MDDSSPSSRRIKTTDTVFAIVETIQELDGATQIEIADQLDFANSTIHSHLHTLAEKGYVVEEDGKYRLGLRFLDHGTYAQENTRGFEETHQTIQDLAIETGEVVWFFVEELGQAVYLDNAMGDKAVRTRGRVGRRAYLHCVAAGKAILANMPDERVRDIVDQHGLPKHTEQTVTNPDRLFEELERVRERGFATNDGEETEGVRAIGAPITVDSDLLGAISVSAPRNRMREDRFKTEIPDKVLGATNEIELKLTF